MRRTGPVLVGAAAADLELVLLSHLVIASWLAVGAAESRLVAADRGTAMDSRPTDPRDESASPLMLPSELGLGLIGVLVVGRGISNVVGVGCLGVEAVLGAGVPGAPPGVGGKYAARKAPGVAPAGDARPRDPAVPGVRDILVSTRGVVGIGEGIEAAPGVIDSAAAVGVCVVSEVDGETVAGAAVLAAEGVENRLVSGLFTKFIL